MLTSQQRKYKISVISCYHPLWGVFFHFLKAFLHQMSDDVEMLGLVGFFMHLSLTSSQLSPQSGIREFIGAVCCGQKWPWWVDQNNVLRDAMQLCRAEGSCRWVLYRNGTLSHYTVIWCIVCMKKKKIIIEGLTWISQWEAFSINLSLCIVKVLNALCL